MRRLVGRTAALLGAVALVVWVIATPALAATRTWNGNGGNIFWATAGNWTGGLPANGDVLVFPSAGVTNKTTSNNFNILSLAGMTLGDGYFLGGNSIGLTGALTLTDGTATVDLDAVLSGVLSATVNGTTLDTTGVLSGAGEVSKSGAGDLSLRGANTYTGNTTVTGGSLTVGHDSALGTTAGNTTVAGGAWLDVGGGTGGLDVAEPLVLDGNGNGFGALTMAALFPANTVSGDITLAGDAGIGVSTGQLILSGAVGGSGELRKNGVSIVELAGSAPNTYSGGTTVTYGYLVLNKSGGAVAVPGPVDFVIGDGSFLGATAEVVGDNQIADDVNVVVGPGGGLLLQHTSDMIGSLRLNGGTVDVRSGGLLTLGGDVASTGAAMVIGSLDLGGSTRNFDVADGAENNGLVVNAVVSGTGSGIVKIGSGTLMLIGNNTYTGVTTVNAGRLLVDGSQPASDVSLTGGTLGGTGTIGPLTAIGGTVAPGHSAGALKVDGDAALSAATTFAVELDGSTPGSGHDQLAVSGAVYPAGATLDVDVGYTPAAGDTFAIIDNDGTDAVLGTFAGLAEGATLTSGGTTFLVSYRGGDGNDVTLAAQAATTTTTTAPATTTTTTTATTTTAPTATTTTTPAVTTTTTTAAGPGFLVTTGANAQRDSRVALALIAVGILAALLGRRRRRMI